MGKREHRTDIDLTKHVGVLPTVSFRPVKEISLPDYGKRLRLDAEQPAAAAWVPIPIPYWSWSKWIVLGPEQAFGMVIGSTQRALPADPRVG